MRPRERVFHSVKTGQYIIDTPGQCICVYILLRVTIHNVNFDTSQHASSGLLLKF